MKHALDAITWAEEAQQQKNYKPLAKHDSTFLNAQINWTMENNYECSERNTWR